VGVRKQQISDLALLLVYPAHSVCVKGAGALLANVPTHLIRDP